MDAAAECTDVAVSCSGLAVASAKGHNGESAEGALPMAMSEGLVYPASIGKIMPLGALIVIA